MTRKFISIYIIFIFPLIQTLTTPNFDDKGIDDEVAQRIANALGHDAVRLIIDLSASYVFVSFNTDNYHVES
jgi:hypothetical protein